MWYEDRWSSGGSNPGYAIATSPTPQGPFTTVADTVRMAPGGGRIGDYDVFVDEDGVAMVKTLRSRQMMMDIQAL